MKNKEQKKKKEFISISLLGKIFTIIAILLICLISFIGIYVVDKNTVKNIIPEYILGMDVYGARNIRIKPEEEIEDYNDVKRIIESRLKYMNVEDYLLSLDESTGIINLEIPENSNTDIIAQYCITKGEFKISDTETKEVFIDNSNVKEAKVQYNTSTTGTTIYLSIQFDEEGTEKLKEISNKYVKSTDEEGNDNSKTIDMTLDSSTILSSYFTEEISNGMLQITIGTSSDSTTLQGYLQQASNIAIFLNTEVMPASYEMDINRFVYSDIETKTIMLIIIMFAIITILFSIYMIIKYKAKGILGVISSIGFIAISLLLIRLGNVTLTLAGIFDIGIMSIIEDIIIILMLKQNRENLTKKELNISRIELLKKSSVTLIPLLIIAVVFALTAWEPISSIGMVIFWTILVMIIYNIFILGMIVLKPTFKE